MPSDLIQSRRSGHLFFFFSPAAAEAAGQLKAQNARGAGKQTSPKANPEADRAGPHSGQGEGVHREVTGTKLDVYRSQVGHVGEARPVGGEANSNGPGAEWGPTLSTLRGRHQRFATSPYSKVQIRFEGVHGRVRGKQGPCPCRHCPNTQCGAGDTAGA